MAVLMLPLADISLFLLNISGFLVVPINTIQWRSDSHSDNSNIYIFCL